MDKDAAFEIVTATWHVFPPLERFVLARNDFVVVASMENCDRLLAALRAVLDMGSAAHTDATCARIRALSREPFMIALADTMPRILSHGIGTAPHAKGFNGFSAHSGAIHGIAQERRAIVAR